MKHTFIPSQLEQSTCAICKKDPISHTKLAQCESCAKREECDIVDNMLMCRACETAHLISLRDSLNSAQKIQDAARIDSAVQNVRNNGDFFNDKIIALTKSIADIKVGIYADESVADKSLAFQRILAERYEHLKDVVFNLDIAKQDAVSEQLVITKTLRDLDKDFRSEIQSRIKELDSTYTPIRKPVKVNIPKSKLSPFERIVQGLAQSSGMSLEQAREVLIKGGVK